MTPDRPPILLVGAGPGDPDLLTLRAEAALRVAGTVVADASVADLAAAWAPRASVRPPGADPDLTAGRLADAVRTGGGASVVRLYRGDPWLHPDFAAEAAALTARGATYEAVPGPPAALALAAEAGIAVHHRPRSVAVTLAPLPALVAATGTLGRTLVTEVADLDAARRCLPPGPPAVTTLPTGATGGGLVIVRAGPVTLKASP
jgi:siroheme synthase